MTIDETIAAIQARQNKRQTAINSGAPYSHFLDTAAHKDNAELLRIVTPLLAGMKDIAGGDIHVTDLRRRARTALREIEQ